MIESLKSSAFFARSGAALSAEYQPQTGITAVVGENGAGKTFLSIESIRWLLYGKAALRGAAGDYKEASVSGWLVIRGARYQLSRGKHEWIKNAAGEVEAKGAEKVTERVTELMGYGLDVFDLCNAATQGNVQMLGAMRPAERKAIIDKVLRLTSAEEAEKACREETKGYRREVETLTKMLRAPGDQPQPPENYLPSASARDRLAAMRETMERAELLRGQLRHVEAPAAPVDSRPAAADIALIQREVDEARELHAKHRNLTVAAGRFSYTLAELDAAEARRQAQAERKRRGPQPTTPVEEIEADWQRHHAADAHTASEEVTCPNCGTSFRPTGEAPAAPRFTKIELREQERRRAAWPDDGPEVPEGLDLDEATILNARRALAARDELANLPPLGADKSGQLATLRRREQEWEVYDRLRTQHVAATAQNLTVQRDLDGLGYLPTSSDLDALYEEKNRAEQYEAACRSYDEASAAYRELQAKIVEAQYLADEYAAGAKDVADARAVVKALIAPRISRIATALVRDMSLGKLTSVEVDEDMDITVGGQRIETLSGAGKTVANLALRIAMGRALVGHVFPVFLADEIDGDLTLKRREATLQALVSLKQHLSQIILVTHRGVDIADHVWNVESTE